MKLRSIMRSAGVLGIAAALACLAEPALAAPTVDKGDVTWMMSSTVFVLLMTVPGLALFYGGLVRSKNMLSIMMQVYACLLYTSPSPRDGLLSRMPSSA